MAGSILAPLPCALETDGKKLAIARMGIEKERIIMPVTLHVKHPWRESDRLRAIRNAIDFESDIRHELVNNGRTSGFRLAEKPRVDLVHLCKFEPISHKHAD